MFFDEFSVNLFVQAYSQKWKVLCSPNLVGELELIQLHPVNYLLYISQLILGSGRSYAAQAQWVDENPTEYRVYTTK